MSDPSQFDADETFQKLLADCLEAVERGEPIDRKHLMREHPEHAESICEFLGNNRFVGEAIGGFRDLGQKGGVDSAFQQTIDSQSAKQSTDFEIGDSLRYVGEYEIIDEIARGGMGIVFRARQSKLRRDVALKMILAGRLASEADVDRFHREARAAAALKHPNIVGVYEVGEHKGHHYFTMDLIDGRSLASIVSEGTLSPQKAAELIEAVAVAIEYAHEHGVLHRDLKPANILIDGDRKPHVTDFGLAKTLAGNAADVDLTATGQILGTPTYMSPEQASARHEMVGVASDVYSLGAILYACLSGRGPFVADSAVDTIRQVIEKEPLALRLLNPQVPKDLETICLKCLRKAPHRRYGTAGELADDLGRFLEGRPIAARPVGVVGKSARWCRRNPLVATLLMMIVLSLASGTVGSTYFAIKENRRAESEAVLRQHAVELAELTRKAQLQTAQALQDARQAQAETERAEKSAEAEAQRALAAEKDARVEAQRATKAEQAARTAEAIASQERETARRALAKSQLDLAEREFERGKFVEAQKILSETPKNFRDENWQFLAAHSRDFTAQLSIPAVGSALQVRFLPQGDRIAARFVYGYIGIFSVTGQRMGAFLRTSAPRVSFDVDRTGNRMAYARSAREVVVQDVATGQLVRRWQCNIGHSGHLMLSPDGEVVLAAGETQLTAYSTQTDSPLWTRPYHGVSPAFSSDGRLVAILASKVGLELSIQLLETATGTVVRTLDATADNPEKTTLQFNLTGDRLACLGGDEMIVWDPQKGTKIRALHFPGETVIRMSPDGASVATISGTRIRLWDSPNGRLLRSLNGAGNRIRELAFSPDGRLLLSSQVSSHDAEINAWPTRLAEEIASVRFSPGESYSRSVIFDHNASKFFASVDRSAGAWDTRSGSQIWDYTTSNNIRDLAIHPVDGSILLSRWGKPRFTHVSPTGEVLAGAGISIPLGASLRFNRTGELLLTVEGAFNNTAAGKSLSVFAYPSGNVLREITFGDISGEIDPFQPFATFCLDDAVVATASKAGGITLWDWKAGTPLREIDAAQTGSIAALASSPDGRQLATCGPDRWIRIWEAATGRLETAFRAHWEGVTFVKFSPDGRDILSGSETGVVRIHEAATGEERLVLYGLCTPVRDADFSRDGTLIAASTKDGITKVWNRRISSAAAQLPESLTQTKRLQTLLLGEDDPKDNTERLALAQLAYDLQKFSFANRLWVAALESGAHLDDNLRYQMVRSALLAAAAKGEVEPPLDSVAKAKFQQQAFDWLQVELATGRADDPRVIGLATELADLLVDLRVGQPPERNPHTLTLPADAEPIHAIRVETSPNVAPTDKNASSFSEYRILSTYLPAEGFRGRYVRIDLPSDGNPFQSAQSGANKYLHLAEFQVFQGDNNIALHQPARQSSTFGDDDKYGANNAVNGDTQGRDTGHPFAHTTAEHDPWWEVDLGDEQSFERIVIWNRPDRHFFLRMNHFRVKILDADRRLMFEQVIDEAPKPSLSISRQVQLAKVKPDAADGVVQWQIRFDYFHDPRLWQRFRIMGTNDPSTGSDTDTQTENVTWTVLEPASVTPATGTGLAVQDDGSFLIDDPQGRTWRLLTEARKIPQPIAYLAATYHLLGDQQALDKLLKHHPQAAAGIGDLYAMNENWQEAIQLYSKLITAQTTDVSLLSKRATAYIATEQWNLAKADWLRVIEQQPDQLQQAFDIFRNAEQWSTAAEFGRRLIEQKPDNSLLWLIVAPVVVLSGDEVAYAEFCQRISQQPTKNLYPAERAIKSSLLRAGGVNLAALPVATLTEALDSGSHPESFAAWGWGTRVLLAYRLGDAESAVKYIAKSEKHNPQGFVRAVTLSILALTQHELQEFDNARKSLDEASQIITRLKEDPNNKGNHNLMIAEILFREAEAKITGKNDSAEDSK